jgi:hypothetical protein
VNRDEVREAFGQEACSVLDGLRSTFGAKLLYAEFADGRSVGKKPEWHDLPLRESEPAPSKRVMTDAEYRQHLLEIEQSWKRFERVRARARG